MSNYATREAAMAALFSLLETALTVSFQTMSRRLQHWDQMDGQSLPALFLSQRPESVKRVAGPGPNVRTMNADIYIYIDSGANLAVAPATDLNNLIDAIDPQSGGILQPDLPLDNRLTLGGLVHDCWIEGEIIFAPGDLDGRGVAVIPVKIQLP